MKYVIIYTSILDNRTCNGYNVTRHECYCEEDILKAVRYIKKKSAHGKLTSWTFYANEYKEVTMYNIDTLQIIVERCIKYLNTPEDITYTNVEELMDIQLRLDSSNEWDPGLNEDICRLAGLEYLEAYQNATGDGFEQVVEAACKALGLEVMNDKFVSDLTDSSNIHLRNLNGKLSLMFSHEFRVSDIGVTHRIAINGFRSLNLIFPIPEDEHKVLSQFKEIVHAYLTCYPEARTEVSRGIIEHML